MTLAQMQYFRAACQFNSLAEASEALHISQPSISVAIRDLEKEFNIAFFYRINKRLKLTNEGKFFYEKIDTILNDIDALEKQLNAMGSNKGLLRIAACPIAGSEMIPGLLAGFKDKMPQVSVELKECYTQVALKLLESDDSDVGLIVGNDVPENCHGIVIRETEFVLCVNKAHRLAEKESIDLTDIANDRIILAQSDSFMANEVKSLFYKNGMVPNVLMYANNASLISSVLSSGDTVAFFSTEHARRLEDCVSIKFNDPIKLSFMLVWPKGKYLHVNASKFLDYVREVYPDSNKIE